MRYDCVKSSFGGECADMQFVQDVALKRQTQPVSVFPGERGVDNLRWPMHALRLKPRSRVGPVFLVIESVMIKRSIWNIFDFCGKISVCGMRKQNRALCRRDNDHINRRSCRRPDAK